jgi:hypothetical protein
MTLAILANDSCDKLTIKKVKISINLINVFL